MEIAQQLLIFSTCSTIIILLFHLITRIKPKLINIILLFLLISTLGVSIYITLTFNSEEQRKINKYYVQLSESLDQEDYDRAEKIVNTLFVYEDDTSTLKTLKSIIPSLKNKRARKVDEIIKTSTSPDLLYYIEEKEKAKYDEDDENEFIEDVQTAIVNYIDDNYRNKLDDIQKNELKYEEKLLEEKIDKKDIRRMEELFEEEQLEDRLLILQASEKLQDEDLPDLIEDVLDDPKTINEVIFCVEHVIRDFEKSNSLVAFSPIVDDELIEDYKDILVDYVTIDSEDDEAIKKALYEKQKTERKIRNEVVDKVTTLLEDLERDELDYIIQTFERTKVNYIMGRDDDASVTFIEMLTNIDSLNNEYLKDILKPINLFKESEHFVTYEEMINNFEKISDSIDVGSGNLGQKLMTEEFEKFVIDYALLKDIEISIRKIDTSEFPHIIANIDFLSDTSDMIIREDMLEIIDTEQTINSFDLEKKDTLLTEIILVIDRSGSMKGQPIDDAKNSSKRLLSQINFLQSKVGVLFFDSSSTFSNMTHKRESLEAYIDKQRPSGDTAMYDAVNRAIEYFDPEIEEKIIILLSDGEDNRSSSTSMDVIKNLNERGVKFYAIGIGDFNTSTLTDIVDKTEGEIFLTPESSQISTIFSKIGKKIRNSYVLSYEVDGSVALSDESRYLNVSLLEAETNDLKYYHNVSNTNESSESNQKVVTVNEDKVLYKLLDNNLFVSQYYSSTFRILGKNIEEEDDILVYIDNQLVKPGYIKVDDNHTITVEVPKNVGLGSHLISAYINGSIYYFDTPLTLCKAEKVDKIQVGNLTIQGYNIHKTSEDNFISSGQVIINDFLYFNGNLEIAGYKKEDKYKEGYIESEGDLYVPITDKEDLLKTFGIDNVLVQKGVFSIKANEESSLISNLIGVDIGLIDVQINDMIIEDDSVEINVLGFNIDNIKPDFFTSLQRETQPLFMPTDTKFNWKLSEMGFDMSQVKLTISNVANAHGDEVTDKQKRGNYYLIPRKISLDALEVDLDFNECKYKIGGKIAFEKEVPLIGGRVNNLQVGLGIKVTDKKIRLNNISGKLELGKEWAISFHPAFEFYKLGVEVDNMSYGNILKTDMAVETAIRTKGEIDLPGLNPFNIAKLDDLKARLNLSEGQLNLSGTGKLLENKIANLQIIMGRMELRNDNVVGLQIKGGLDFEKEILGQYLKLLMQIQMDVNNSFMETGGLADAQINENRYTQEMRFGYEWEDRILYLKASGDTNNTDIDEFSFIIDFAQEKSWCKVPSIEVKH